MLLFLQWAFVNGDTKLLEVGATDGSSIRCFLRTRGGATRNDGSGNFAETDSQCDLCGSTLGASSVQSLPRPVSCAGCARQVCRACSRFDIAGDENECVSCYAARNRGYLSQCTCGSGFIAGMTCFRCEEVCLCVRCAIDRQISFHSKRTTVVICRACAVINMISCLNCASVHSFNDVFECGFCDDLMCHDCLTLAQYTDGASFPVCRGCAAHDADDEGELRLVFSESSSEQTSAGYYSPHMNIEIRVHGCGVWSIRVPCGCHGGTVLSMLQRDFQARTGVVLPDGWLSFQGHDISTRSLSDSGITSNSSLYYRFRVRDGGWSGDVLQGQERSPSSE